MNTVIESYTGTAGFMREELSKTMITKFTDLYEASRQEEQKARYEKIRAGFAELFGEKDVTFISAPGRTEVGGNHTDHQHGCVLAAAVDLDIVAAAAPNGEQVMRLKSAEYPKMDEIDLTDLSVHEEEKESSAALLRGVCARCRELGYRVEGFDAYTMTQVLKGSGLSSSAAFEVVVVHAISHLFNNDAIDAVTAAQISQYAENVYFGKPSGLMDQTASSVGGFTAIDFADPSEPKFKKVDFNLAAHGYALCIVDTGGNHADLTGDYASIPVEMKQVANELGVDFLRDADESAFYARLGEIRKKTGDRAVLRAMHFFDDNRLAQEEANALAEGNLDAFLEMEIRSGRSSFMRLQNVFACSNPSEQGLSLALALSEKLLAGKKASWRVHGGGFAGTVQAFVPVEELSHYKTEMEKVFGEGTCHVLSVRRAGGTRVDF